MQRHSLLENSGDHEDLSNSTANQKQAGKTLIDTVRGLVPPTHPVQLKLVFNDKIRHRRSIKRKQDENKNLSQLNQMAASSKPVREKPSCKKTQSCRKKETISPKNERKDKRGPPYRPNVLSQKQLFGKCKRLEKHRHMKSAKMLAVRKNQLTLKKKMKQGLNQANNKVERLQLKESLMHDSSSLHFKMKQKQTYQVITSEIHKEHIYPSLKCEQKQEIKTEIQYKDLEHTEMASNIIYKFRFKHRHNSSRKHKTSLEFANHVSVSNVSQMKPRRDETSNIRPVNKAEAHINKEYHKQALSRRPQLNSEQVRKGESRLKKWNH